MLLCYVFIPWMLCVFCFYFVFVVAVVIDSVGFDYIRNRDRVFHTGLTYMRVQQCMG